VVRLANSVRANYTNDTADRTTNVTNNSALNVIDLN
jgi:hypothetical protein